MRKQKEKISFLRGAVMHAPLPISPKINKKVILNEDIIKIISIVDFGPQ